MFGKNELEKAINRENLGGMDIYFFQNKIRGLNELLLLFAQYLSRTMHFHLLLISSK